MSEPTSAAKPSTLTYELMVIGHADISNELRRREAGLLPHGSHSSDDPRRMLLSIENMMAECRLRQLN